jgi:hypothetical protein
VPDGHIQQYAISKQHMEIKMLFSRSAQSAAALFLLAIGFAAPAHAQNNKQIISGTWYEDRAQINNANSSLIQLTFTQTPTNQFLNVTNVSCSITVIANQILDTVTLFAGTTSGNDDLGRDYSIRGSATSETSTFGKPYSIVTNQVFYKMGPGRYPTIGIFAPTSTSSSTTTANCVIVGNLTDN